MPYSQDQALRLREYHLGYLRVAEQHHVLTITLNRPEAHNSLHPQMINELALALRYAHFKQAVWAVVIQAEGEVFCAGADLTTIAGVESERPSTVPLPEQAVWLTEVFAQVHKPCIAKVAGNVYGHGLLLLAGCHYVVACNHIRLGLPEVKRGLFPFQVMAALQGLVPPRKILDWCMRGYAVEVEQALEWGLVTQISITEQLDQDVAQLLSALQEGAPAAIRLGLEAFHHLQLMGSASQHQYLHDKFMETLATKDAQEGWQAQAEQRSPRWTAQ